MQIPNIKQFALLFYPNFIPNKIVKLQNLKLLYLEYNSDIEKYNETYKKFIKKFQVLNHKYTHIYKDKNDDN